MDFTPGRLTDLAAMTIAKSLTRLEASDDSERADEVAESLASHPPDAIAMICESMPWDGLFALWGRFALAYAPHLSARRLDAAMAQTELRYRQAFAVNRSHSELRNPHLMLIDVFSNPRLFVLGQVRDAAQIGKDTHATRQDFKIQMNNHHLWPLALRATVGHERARGAGRGCMAAAARARAAPSLREPHQQEPSAAAWGARGAKCGHDARAVRAELALLHGLLARRARLEKRAVRGCARACAHVTRSL